MPDATDADGLPVGQVSKRLGVTVRALHHWDEIGLARPSLRTAAGYRLYTAGDLERLHRIVVYREIGLGLDRIQAVLDDSATDVPGALRAQRTQVAERIERLQQLGAGLDRMIDAHERGLLLTAEQQAAVFGPQWDPDGPARARQLWGDTAQWRQYAERSASRGPEEWQAVADAVAALDRALGDAMDSRRHAWQPGGEPARRAAPRSLRLVLSPHQTDAGLSRPLVRGRPGVRRPLRRHPRQGLATWFRRIVDAEARAHGIDPDTATWQ